MVYIVRYHHSLPLQRYRKCVRTVWDKTDIKFRTEHREKAPHQKQKILKTLHN